MRAAILFILVCGFVAAGSMVTGYAFRGVLAPQAHTLFDLCKVVRR